MQDQAIPQIGFGLWKVDQDRCADTVVQAIETGYRHFDSASDYGNEQQTGDGFKRALESGLCQRSDLWVTSKLWNTDHAPEHVEAALDKSLADLQLDYLDLYLIHFPIALAHIPHQERYPAGWFHDPQHPENGMKTAAVPLHETWAAMEDLLASGKTKRIGVCNYNSALMFDLLNYAKVKPSMLQIEAHPFLTQDRLLKVCQLQNIPVTAFSPLGALSYLELDMANESESVLQNNKVLQAAEAHGKTAAQVVLRWGIQRGTAVIPKTSKLERMRENLNVFDFELSEAEMLSISSLNQNRRFNDPGDFCESAFNTFHPIYD